MFTTQCATCKESVGQGPVCASCENTFHFHCSGTTERGFNRLGVNRSSWKCVQCRDENSLLDVSAAPSTSHSPARLSAASLEEYSSAFDALPQIDPPNLLGLPANCRIAWERNAANDIIGGLKEIDTSANTQQESKNSVTPLKMILALWKNLMSGSPLLKNDYKVEEAAGWWGGACACEAREAAAAARALHGRLAALARAPARAASLHKVPEEWQALWAGPEWPETYLREFCPRAHAAVARLSEHFPADYLPKEVNLQEWLRPSRVIWALRAHAAAALACAPHALTLSAKWDTEWSGPGALSLTGLRLSGAEWRGSLAPAPPAAPPLAPAPALLLRYVPEGGGAPREVAGTAEVWVYSSATRAEGVVRVRAPLAAGFDADAAALHAVALVVAPRA